MLIIFKLFAYCSNFDFENAFGRPRRNKLSMFAIRSHSPFILDVTSNIARLFLLV